MSGNLTRRAAIGFLPLATASAPNPGRLDAYGGLRAVRLAATGWFRLARLGECDILVTPEGHAFLALGVNHIGMLARGGRNFDWSRYRETLASQLRAWNFNNLGYGAPAELERFLPYFAALTLAPIEKHRSHPVPGRPDSYVFPDVFDPAWQRQLDQDIAQACRRHRDNPYLIGYFWTDTPTWDIVKTRALRATDWVSEIRKLPAGAPGRRAYADFIARRYEGRLAELNTIYGLNLTAPAELVGADLSRIAIGRHLVGEDDREFLGLIARQYYETAGRAQRRHDPHHLVFGERYLAGDAPARVLRAALPYIDAVAVQPGDRYTRLHPASTTFPEREISRLHRITGKPVLICDHAISFPSAAHPRPIFESRPTEEEAARATELFLRQAMAQPCLLGYLRCQYIDRPAAFGRGLRQGLLTEEGQPYALIVAAYRRMFAAWLDRIEALGR